MPSPQMPATRSSSARDPTLQGPQHTHMPTVCMFMTCCTPTCSLCPISPPIMAGKPPEAAIPIHQQLIMSRVGAAAHQASFHLSHISLPLRLLLFQLFGQGGLLCQQRIKVALATPSASSCGHTEHAPRTNKKYTSIAAPDLITKSAGTSIPVSCCTGSLPSCSNHLLAQPALGPHQQQPTAPAACPCKH